jgi:hypothetical protein
LRGIVVDANTHTTSVGRDVVNTIGDGFPKFLINEVMHVHLVGTAFRTIVAVTVLV